LVLDVIRFEECIAALSDFVANEVEAVVTAELVGADRNSSNA
jgi:hypothetical protein